MATRVTESSQANLTKNLKGIDFPANKQDLLKQAQHLHAEKVVIDEIQRMPEREYSSMADVMKNFESEAGSKSRSSSSTSSSQRSGQQVGQQSKSSHGKSSHK